MKLLHRLLLGLALLAGAVPAFSAYSCSVTTNPTDMNVVYSGFWTALNTTGSVTVSCTRNPSTDPRQLTIWIGMDQTTAGRNATLDTGGSTLRYEIFHGGQTSGTWTDTGGVVHTSGTNAAVQETLNFGNASSVSATYTFYFNVPAFQWPIRPAGVYVDAVPITLRQGNQNGAILGTASMDVHISIVKSCRFSTPPGAISVNYVAFSPMPVTASTQFGITCTKGTPYQLSLTPLRSVVPTVDLAYGLTLGAPTGSITGSAVEQSYMVNVSVDAGQAGTCSTSMCSGTDTSPVLTVTY